MVRVVVKKVMMVVMVMIMMVVMVAVVVTMVLMAVSIQGGTWAVTISGLVSTWSTRSVWHHEK